MRDDEGHTFFLQRGKEKCLVFARCDAIPEIDEKEKEKERERPSGHGSNPPSLSLSLPIRQSHEIKRKAQSLLD